MPANDNHHFVPRFLLETWASPTDHKLSAYRRIHGGFLESKRRSPKAVAKVLGLYASRSYANKNYVETEYITPVIDNPGASAYHTLLDGGISELTDVQIAAWVRFVIALRFRGPDTIREMKERLDAETSGDPMTLIRKRDPQNPWLQSPDIEVARQFLSITLDAIGAKALPHFVEAPVWNQALNNGVWEIRELSRSKHDLVISDRPLNFQGALAGKFVIVLPLAPRRAFIVTDSSATQDMMQSIPESRFVEACNEYSIRQAAEYVFAAHDGHRRFVDKHLRPIDATGKEIAG